MKTLRCLIIGAIAGISSLSLSAQNKGLLISELLANPDGNDSPYEYVELLATANINFATTPYTVVFTDNGNATADGWRAGNSVTYAFVINTGSVTPGQVIYVGGSSMAPLSHGGIAARSKNTGNSNGDTFGTSKSDGVLGNGGDNCDGIAVFNVTASAISASTVPVDAIFFGNSAGSAYRSSSSGYQMPVNDRYSGGKLAANLFLATDPGANDILKATGAYNPATNTFTTVRSWTKSSNATYNTSSITLTAPSNISPSITLATPVVSGNAPATVTLSATASDADGSIARVEFYNGTTLLATVNAAPYTYTWTGVSAGTYSITAKATDNLDAYTTSPVKTATVNNGIGGGGIGGIGEGGIGGGGIGIGNGPLPIPPAVELYTPVVSSNAPATVTLSATASDNGSITKVVFFNGTTLLATITTAPYTYQWTNVAAGTYSITAKATDNENMTTVSAVKTITVGVGTVNMPPVITLAAPAVSGNAPATITLSATASDADGNIARVEFYNGATLLGTKTSAPYTYSWTNVAAGTYSITAKAIDNLNAVTTSAVKTATVNSAANVAPTLVFNTTASKYVDLASGKVSCVMNNPTDPVIVDGLDITVTDDNPGTLTFTMTSSKTAVVPNANFTITGTGTARKFRINPVGVGYATITLKVTDAQGLSKTISFSLAVSASLATNTVQDVYHTGVADGSTGIAIDNEYMFVADDETNVIKLFSRNHSGLSLYQFDVTQYLDLDGTEVDMEASFRSPTNPNRIYWLGSLSNSKTGQARPDRNRIFATDIVGTGINARLTFVGYYSNLRSKLITWGNNNGYNFTDKAATGIEPKRIDGFNIEGMEMGPDGTTLYLGFRAPYVGGSNNKALICPFQNFEAWFNNGNPSGNPVFGAPIVLGLNNHGIRSLAKNAANEFLIVAGSYAATGTFELYAWNGLPASAPELLDADLSQLKPEGIVTVPQSLTQPFQVTLISDLGSNIMYNDGLENKEVVAPNHRKFLSSVVNVSPAGGRPSGALGMPENEQGNFIYYPNPAADKVTIEFSKDQDLAAGFSIYSVNGTLVRTTQGEISMNEATLDLSGIAPGSYLVKINNTGSTIRISKQ